jgi:methyl-accepting chemotaxis protein
VTRADAGASALLGFAAESDDALAGITSWITRARESLGSLEALAQELRSWDNSARALQTFIDEGAAWQRARERRAEELEASAGQAARLCEQLQLDVERGATSSERVRGELDRVEPASNEARAAIEALNARVVALRATLEDIDDLTEQMTLLALNAAIVAAQAGESGKGFAVVADGMKDLADRAQVTEKHLSQCVDGLDEPSKLALRAVERAGSHVQRGVDASADAALAGRHALELTQRFVGNASVHVREASQRTTNGVVSADEPLARASVAAQQLVASIGQRLRELTAVAEDAETLRTGAQPLERKQHEHGLRGRQLAAQAETVARTLEQLAKLKRSQRRAFEEAAPALDRMRELMRDHERRLSAMIGIAQNVPRPGAGRGPS